MNPRVFFDVDPALLRLPHSRLDGADPVKLHRQIAKHGKSLAGMPPILVHRGSDGELMITDGVTRATRAVRLCPGVRVVAELLSDMPHPLSHLPTVAEKIS